MTAKYPKNRIIISINLMPTIFKNYVSKFHQIGNNITITIYIAKMHKLLANSMEFYINSDPYLKQVLHNIVSFVVYKRSFLLSGIV